MRRLAIFVEGYTELQFVERLLIEIAGKNRILIEKNKVRGGRNAPIAISILESPKPATSEEFYVLLMDCGGDKQVSARILQQHKSLTSKNYTKIIGIRDVRPDFSRADIARLEVDLKKYIKTSLIPVVFILSIMEIEAWFLSEFNHFPKINPAITISAIEDRLGFNPEKDDLSLRSDPAKDLENVYALGGEVYEKGGDEKTLNVIDYSFVYLELKSKIPYLEKFINCIDDFLIKGD